MANVLLIEDDPDIQFNLRLLLEGEGYSVISASDGEEGLEALAPSRPPIDVVLLDLMMPRLNGEQFLQRLHRSGELQSRPVILLSASRDAGALARRFGVDLVTKPIDIERLLSLLARHCPFNAGW